MKLNSLKELGKMFGIDPKAKEAKPRKCKYCGSDLEQVAGGNVWVCHGEVIKTDADGNESKIPCTNVVIGRAV